MHVRKPLARWLVGLRQATGGQPTFVFFPHAGGSPLSVGRLAAALPGSAGIVAVQLPRGDERAPGEPPRRAAAAADRLAQELADLQDHDAREPVHLVLVGNSYGALLAYETAHRLAHCAVPAQRLIVSGFRAPVLAPAEAPLHLLPPAQLRTELAARFGMAPVEIPAGQAGYADAALRADLEACETYRHAHAELLSAPIDVLRMADDSSLSASDLQAWQAVTTGPMRIVHCAAGHFPWATHPREVANLLTQLAGDSHREPPPCVPSATITTHSE